MRRAGTLRGWIAAALVVAAAAVCIRLGFWQLDRHAQRQARNDTLQAAIHLPTVDLDAHLVASASDRPAELVYRRVRVRGEYLPAAEVVWRGRARDGVPGVHLLTPLRLEGSADVVYVDRGWVPSPDAARIDPKPLRESGRVEAEALIQLFPEGPIEAAAVWTDTGGDSILSLRRLDPELLGAHVGEPVLGYYLQQLPSAGQPTPPYRASIPSPALGPHLNYAFQWFGFAAVFLVGLTVLVIRRR